jgi:hypothetical protein
LVFGRTVPQATFARELLANPLFNYASLTEQGDDTQRLLRMGWVEVSRFDDIVVLKRAR